MAGTRDRRMPAWLVGSGVIAMAMGIMNLGTYGFTILAARVLGPVEYGALAAVMGLLLVVNVMSLGLQATGARRVAADPHQTLLIERGILRASYMSALALGTLCLVLSPVISAALRLDEWWIAAMLAVTVLPLTVMGGQAGILQGERRWLPLAAIYLGTGLGRILFGGFALWFRPDALGAMAGVAIGAFVPTIAGWFAIRHPSRGHVAPDTPGAATHEEASTSTGGLFREIAHNSHALLAFFALSNADVVLARAVLDERDAGLYAAGLIMTKAVLFLPQFVVVIAYPSMSSAGRAGARALQEGLRAVVAIGAVTVGTVWLFSGLAVVFIGGAQYAEAESLLWAFATLGTVLALLQFMVYEVVARQSQRLVYLIWGTLAVLVAIAIAASLDSVTALLTTVLVVDTLLLTALLVISRAASPQPHAP